MHNSRGSVVRTYIRKKSHKIAANLKKVPHVSLRAKTIYGLFKIFEKQVCCKGQTRENTVLFFLKKRLSYWRAFRIMDTKFLETITRVSKSLYKQPKKY